MVNKNIAHICLLFSVYSMFSMKAPNLRESEQLIKSSEGLRAFNEQIEGCSEINIGKNLPRDVTCDELSQLVFKKSYKQISGKLECNALLMQSWPGRPGFYIGIGAIRDRGSFTTSSLQIFITIFTIKKPHVFEIIAQTEKPFVFKIENPTNIEDFDDQEELLDEFVRIDRAVFKISRDENAFGVRFARNVGYSGGFAQFHNLILFRLKDKKIVPILNIPIYCLQNLAGDWNDDGTREHYVIEKEWIVCLTNVKHKGYFDILIKQKKIKQVPHRFIWDGDKYIFSKNN